MICQCISIKTFIPNLHSHRTKYLTDHHSIRSIVVALWCLQKFIFIEKMKRVMLIDIRTISSSWKAKHSRQKTMQTCWPTIVHVHLQCAITRKFKILIHIIQIQITRPCLYHFLEIETQSIAPWQVNIPCYFIYSNAMSKELHIVLIFIFYILNIISCSNIQQHKTQKRANMLTGSLEIFAIQQLQVKSRVIFPC